MAGIQVPRRGYYPARRLPPRLLRRVTVQVLHQQRARPDPAHLAAQDIDKLGKFIQAAPAQEPSHPGDAGVPVCGPLGAAAFGIPPHGAELEDLEEAAVEPHARLAVEDRPGRGELHEDRGRDEERAGRRVRRTRTDECCRVLGVVDSNAVSSGEGPKKGRKPYAQISFVYSFMFSHLKRPE